MKPYKFPFRVGRKQRRAVLDAEGSEIVVFPKGCEDMAIEFATFKNTMEAERLKALNGNSFSTTPTSPPPKAKNRPYDSQELGYSFPVFTTICGPSTSEFFSNAIEYLKAGGKKQKKE